MENKFLDSGALFLNDRKQNEKAPDWKGDVEFSTDLVMHLYGECQKGNSPKVALAGWNRKTKTGKPFVSVKVSAPFTPKESAIVSAPKAAKNPWE
jgi:hypothetical protein